MQLNLLLQQQLAAVAALLVVNSHGSGGDDGRVPDRYRALVAPQIPGPQGVLTVKNFGAVGDGKADDSGAIQRAIDQAQRQYRALFVPAGIYRIDHGLFVNTTTHSDGPYSPATDHWKVAPLRLIGEGATNGEGQSVIFAAKPMGAVLTYVSRQAPDSGSRVANQLPANLTMNHELEKITLDANELANFSVYAPAIVGSKWNSVSFVHGLIAGLYIGYGWIHNIEGCAFKNNNIVNLYLDRAINSVNVVNNNFAAGLGMGIVANHGEALRIEGNCFQSLGGPAIYANQMGALKISESYYEANNLAPEMYHWLGQEDLCAEVILNGAGNQTGGHWSATEWGTNPARLEALVAAGPPGGPKYVMAPQPLLADNCYGSAEVSLSYHNPDHSHCTTSQYFGVFVAGGDAITVRNNDCRACSRSNSSRVCTMLGGNSSNVEQTHNSGDWSKALKSDDNELSLLKGATNTPPPQGWVGVYHAASGTVHDGKNTSAYDVGSWGIVSPVDAPFDGGSSGFTFRESIEFHCRTKSINQLLGMLTAQSEGGAYNNPNDNETWNPLPTKSCSSSSPSPSTPRGPQALLQGAARYSTLARTFCPQLSGAVIDDFFENYHPPSPPATAALHALASSSPSLPSNCSGCPSNRSHMYGTVCSGFYCCPVAPTNHCTPPPGHKPSGGCCLWAGVDNGCQGFPSCNVATKPPCGSGLPPGPAPPANEGLDTQQIRNIKAALQGKTLRSDGTVDHDSEARTPHLKLFVVTYHNQIDSVSRSKVLLSEKLVDGISFWIGGPEQRELSSNLTALVAELRHYLPSGFPVFTGGYITYSSIGWTEPQPFYDLLDQSIRMYDNQDVQGFFLFAGSVLHSMNATLWQTWDLPGHLSTSYFPWLGTGQVTVTSKETATVPPNATVVIMFGSSTHVTRKVVDAHGRMTFGGWVGKAKKIPHTVTVTASGYDDVIASLQLKARETVRLAVEMTPKISEEINHRVGTASQDE